MAPAQTVAGVAVGDELKLPPLIAIVTASVFVHDVVVEVAVKVKTVVSVRFIVVGSSTKALTSFPEGDQLYVNGPVPETVALIAVLVPYGFSYL